MYVPSSKCGRTFLTAAKDKDTLFFGGKIGFDAEVLHCDWETALSLGNPMKQP